VIGRNRERLNVVNVARIHVGWSIYLLGCVFALATFITFTTFMGPFWGLFGLF